MGRWARAKRTGLRARAGAPERPGLAANEGLDGMTGREPAGAERRGARRIIARSAPPGRLAADRGLGSESGRLGPQASVPRAAASASSPELTSSISRPSCQPRASASRSYWRMTPTARKPAFS